MDKERLHREIDEIEVPQSEIYHAIEKGMEEGRKEKVPKRRSKVKFFSAAASIAAVAFLAAGFIFAPISYALSSIPLLGSIYDKVGMQIGEELLESDLVTQLNQKASSKGVDITITSAYYDGNVIGITFNAKGDKLSLDRVGGAGPEAGYGFHLFDGKEQNQWSASMSGLKETEDGYIASIEFYNDDADLLENDTLPLTFTSMTGVKGRWKFDVPVEQIPSETIYSEAATELEGSGYSLQMESIVKGKATTILNYKTTLPLAGKEDELRITVFDNEGNRLSKFHPNVLTTEIKANSVVKKNQEMFSSSISEDATYLTVQPEIVKSDKDIVQTMDQSTPFTVESSRFDYSIKVNSIQQEGDQLILDYHIQNVDTGSIREDVIQYFADFIMIIKSDNVQRDETGELNMMKMLEYRIRSDQATLQEDGNRHFQSIFELKDQDTFDYRNYSIEVPFGTLSENEEPIKMEPMKVELE
ncbi:DUF4179 domain-containing protein [Gracilibacillus caseinilyticus]|uniref:DUF4179 domain-containing protein n=1 Tax=Gracilibacillus caseinilyticus TaxID=2932256 RepID=A0ABY4F1I2_9BACI|nr:DUF4179 domain-containing protein [Gracilibacillus caseinilyticus]UOQ50400.1 DUF4179 domain-containing protein [Gracilibacillus caseinilyticus]